jgi:hypothetical protein
MSQIMNPPPVQASEVPFTDREGQISTTITAKPTRGRQTLRFLRPFGEMFLTMLLGMGAFDLVNSLILVPLGFPYLSARFSPEAFAAAMAISMTVPMVAWMRIRRHTWRLSAEMAGAMLVPIALLIIVCSIGLLPHTILIPATHILMVPAMLGAMLYRWRDYTCH